MNNISEIISHNVDLGQTDQLGLLKSLCNIDSGSMNITGNSKVVEIVTRELETIGATIEKITDPKYGTNIVARFNSNNEYGKIILAAHMDTVFKEGDAAKHPFHVEGEYAHGLGVADCKGGVVTIIHALKTLKKANLLPKKEVIVVLNCDEEIGSPSSQKIFEQVAPGADAVLSFEPGRKKNGILTSRYGLAEGSIKVKGQSAHACMDNGPGVNAIVELAHTIIKLNDNDNDELGIHYNVAPIAGGKGPSVVADQAEGDFWVTFKSLAAYEQIKAYILNSLPEGKVNSDCEIETNLNLLFPPMERSEANVNLYNKIAELASEFDINLPEEMSKSPADCNYYASHDVPTIDGLGPYMFDIHTVNERILLSSLYERTKLAAYLIHKL